ncbi:hypothetical protein ACTDI4_09265 [Mesorhizobium sp. PUT5]|uniref:hypothetical protein n=1 Tax=Mesorhizobium sp. PUT5 TaxID=3454629 RepID=UPI003FA48285
MRIVMFVREKTATTALQRPLLACKRMRLGSGTSSSGQEKKKPGGCPPGSISIAND